MGIDENACGQRLDERDWFFAAGVRRSGLAHEPDGLPGRETILIFPLRRAKLVRMRAQIEKGLPFRVGKGFRLPPK